VGHHRSDVPRPLVQPSEIVESSGGTSVKFAHDSERDFAKLLDFYAIRWEYEPRSFPLVWDEHGRVLESFSPDFYLPDFDLYIELTTLKQSLVTRKNRKVRRMRELYPHVRLKIFYGRDYRSLLAKYGLSGAVAG
jgi:hypoxanthine phosphoribosyltransferase